MAALAPRSALRPIVVVADTRRECALAHAALAAARVPNPVLELAGVAELIPWLLAHRAAQGAGRAQLPVAVLVDLRTGGPEALQALRCIRADPVMHRLPVVMLADSQAHAEVAASYAEGASSCVVRPLELERFAERLGRVGVYWCRINVPPG